MDPHSNKAAKRRNRHQLDRVLITDSQLAEPALDARGASLAFSGLPRPVQPGA